ncbi:NAD(P)-binding protein [Thozetella sp. PMI_491]|nr:NAD(P)-binding protein [Thozetella sp. PMI_491]
MASPILVLGATGKQGGGVIRALLAHPNFSPEEHIIYSATRDPTSASAQRLSALSPSIKPIQGDLRTPKATFANLPRKPFAAFIITYPGKTELEDGIATIDSAVAAGVSHIVFSSVERGQNSPATHVPHFITKHRIETHLKDTVAKAGNNTLSYTIIRPPFFLDNLEPGFLGKIFTTLWRDNVQRPLAVIDTADIGNCGAAAILEAKSSVYHNAEISLVGDNLTFENANEIFRRKKGYSIPTTFSFVANLLLLLVPSMRTMFEFYNDPAFVAAGTPEESNKLYHVAKFEEWVDRSKHVSKRAK